MLDFLNGQPTVGGDSLADMNAAVYGGAKRRGGPGLGPKNDRLRYNTEAMGDRLARRRADRSFCETADLKTSSLHRSGCEKHHAGQEQIAE